MLRTKPYSSPEVPVTGQEYTFFNIIFLAISCVIGTGVYFSSVTTAATSGSASVPALFICVFLCLFIALPFAELSTRIPGFTYEYIYCTCGEFFALFYSFTTLVTNVFVSAINAQLWANTIRNALGYDLDYLEVLPIIAISGLVIAGRRTGAVASNIVTIINLTNAILASFLLLTQDNFTFPWKKLTSGIEDIDKMKAAFPVWFFTLLGFENVGVFSRGIKNPGKIIPMSMIIALVSAAVLNLFTFIGVFGQSKEPNVSSVIDMIEWNQVKTVMRFTSICGITSSSLWITILQGEVMLTLGKDGLMPSILSVQNSAGIPYISIMFHVLFSIICCYSGSISELISTLSWAIIGMPMASIGLIFSHYEANSPSFFQLKKYGFFFAITAITLGLLDSFSSLRIINSWLFRIFIFIVMIVIFSDLCKKSRVTCKPALVNCIWFPYLPIISSLLFFFLVGYVMNVKSFLFVLTTTFLTYLTYSRNNSNLAKSKDTLLNSKNTD